jgi:rhodanese-related sulfurtransferase
MCPLLPIFEYCEITIILTKREADKKDKTTPMDHSPEFLEIVNDAKSRIMECDVDEARARITSGGILIDVREDNEWDAGHAAGAIHMGRGIIERDIVQKYPDKDQNLVLYCGGGYRSALAADMLQKMGYNRVFSMDGGWKAWQDSGAPVEK